MTPREELILAALNATFPIVGEVHVAECGGTFTVTDIETAAAVRVILLDPKESQTNGPSALIYHAGHIPSVPRAVVNDPEIPATVKLVLVGFRRKRDDFLKRSEYLKRLQAE